MAHIAIICKTPRQLEPDPNSPFPGVTFEQYPTLTDCYVLIDGKEATNIEEIVWSVKQGEATRCAITFVGAVLHVEQSSRMTAEEIEALSQLAKPVDYPKVNHNG